MTRVRSIKSYPVILLLLQTTALSDVLVLLRRDDVAQAGAQPVIRAREDGEAQRRQQVEERAPRDPDAVVADLVALLDRMVCGVVEGPPGGLSGRAAEHVPRCAGGEARGGA